MPSLAGLRTQAASLAARAHQTWKGDSLSSRLIRNAGWITIGYGFEIFIRFLSSLILTRLLDPGVYGLVTTVSVFVTIAVMLSDLGVRTIVQTDDRGDDKEFLGTIWTVQVIRGFALAAILGLVAIGWRYMQLAGMLGEKSLYHDPLLPGLLALVSTSLILKGFSGLNEFRLLRHLDRGPVAQLDIVSRIVTTLLTVLLVLIWPTVWAVGLSIVLGTGIRTVLTLVMLSGPRMELRLHWGEMKKVIAHSRWVALSSALTVTTMSADKLLIGYSFDLNVLGVYSIAFTLFTAAMAIVDHFNLGMGIPVLRAIADKTPADQARAFYKFRLPIELYCGIGGVGMVLFSPLLFKLAYDPRYAAGGLFLALLGIKLILTPITFSGNFLLAIQRFKLVSVITGVRTVLFLGMLGLAAWLHSIELMVLAVALERLPEILLYLFLPGTGIPFDWRRDGLLLGISAASLVYLLI